MDQSQIQQQLLADTPLDKLHLSFTEMCELLLQQNSGILKDLQDSHAQDGIEMKSAKRLHLRSSDAAIHITLDLVTPKEPKDGQPTYLIFSINDLLTNLKQLVVQSGQTYTRLVYNEALEDPNEPPENIINEPANRVTMVSAVMRLNTVEPVHEDLLMLQLPQISMPPAPEPVSSNEDNHHDEDKQAEEDAPANKDDHSQDDHAQNNEADQGDNQIDNQPEPLQEQQPFEAPHTNEPPASPPPLNIELPKPAAYQAPGLGNDESHNNFAFGPLPQLRPEQTSFNPPSTSAFTPPSFPLNAQPAGNPQPSSGQRGAFNPQSPPPPPPPPPLPFQSPAPMQNQGSNPLPQPPQYSNYTPASPMGAPSMIQPPPQTISPTSPPQGMGPGQSFGQPPQQAPNMYGQTPPNTPGQGPNSAPPPGSFFQIPQ